MQSIAINSKAFIYQNEDKIEFIGSKTECAMLIFMSNILEEDYKPIREATEIIKMSDSSLYYCFIVVLTKPLL